MDRVLYFVRSRTAWLVLGLLMLVHSAFWLAFARLSQVVLGEQGLQHGALELLIVVLAPLAFVFWAALGRHGLEPSTTAKFSLAFVLLAMSWFCLGVGVEWGRAPVAACVSLLIVSALCIGPASLVAVEELSAGEHGRAWLGVWVLGYAIARVSGRGIDPAVRVPDELVAWCATVGLSCVLAAVLLAFVWRPITELARACELQRFRLQSADVPTHPEKLVSHGRRAAAVRLRPRARHQHA